MYGYIYKITIEDQDSKLNGCYYIGRHKDNGKSYWGSGIILEDYKNKHGTKGLSKEILCECFTEDELNEKEIEYINDLYITDAYFKGGKCLNLKAGGHACGISEETREKHRVLSTGRHHTEETKQKLSSMKKGISCTKNIGRKASEETKRKQSLALKGRKYTEEQRKHMSEIRIERQIKHTDETKMKISLARKGFRHTEEAKQKMSECAKGKHWWNNGVEQKFCESCPGDDWVLGILHRKEYRIKKQTNGIEIRYAKKLLPGYIEIVDEVKEN